MASFFIRLHVASYVPAWLGINQRHEAIGAPAMDVLKTLLRSGITPLLTFAPAPAFWCFIGGAILVI